MPRRRRPSQFRFLVPLLTVAPFVAIIWFSTGMLATVCDHLLRGAACPVSAPWWVWGGMFMMIVGASLLSWRRYLLDFHEGEYYMDLSDPGWRHRR